MFQPLYIADMHSISIQTVTRSYTGIHTIHTPFRYGIVRLPLLRPISAGDPAVSAVGRKSKGGES